jgi:aldehyde:ferredoxin oxidoreductase
MLDDYYNLRGWDKRGIPTRETLEKLELNDLEEELVKLWENDGHKD